MVSLGFFTSCQKDSPVLSNKKTAYEERVISWLDKEKSDLTKKTKSFNTNAKTSNTSKDDMIELIKQNLLFENLNVELDEKTISYIAVPISDDIKNKKKADQNSTLLLILTLDKEGEIRTGGILYFIPADGKRRASLSSNTFRNVLYEKSVDVDGTYKFLSITGRWISQIQIKNGKQFSLGFIHRNSETGVRQTQRTNGCIDWYLVTTYYYTDGTTETTKEYVGTTCEGCENGELVSLCRDPEFGGGGSEGETPEEIIEEKVGTSVQTFDETSYSQDDYSTSSANPMPYSFRSAVGYVYDLTNGYFKSVWSDGVVADPSTSSYLLNGRPVVRNVNCPGPQATLIGQPFPGIGSVRVGFLVVRVYTWTDVNQTKSDEYPKSFNQTVKVF